MQNYTFKIPPAGEGLAFFFDLDAHTTEEAISKARRLLSEQSSETDELHVDLTYGLTHGRVRIAAQDITPDSIILVRSHPVDSVPF